MYLKTIYHGRPSGQHSLPPLSVQNTLTLLSGLPKSHLIMASAQNSGSQHLNEMQVYIRPSRCGCLGVIPLDRSKDL